MIVNALVPPCSDARWCKRLCHGRRVWLPPSGWPTQLRCCRSWFAARPAMVFVTVPRELVTFAVMVQLHGAPAGYGPPGVASRGSPATPDLVPVPVPPNVASPASHRRARCRRIGSKCCQPRIVVGRGLSGHWCHRHQCWSERTPCYCRRVGRDDRCSQCHILLLSSRRRHCTPSVVHDAIVPVVASVAFIHVTAAKHLRAIGQRAGCAQRDGHQVMCCWRRRESGGACACRCVVGWLSWTTQVHSAPLAPPGVSGRRQTTCPLAGCPSSSWSLVVAAPPLLVTVNVGAG